MAYRLRTRLAPTPSGYLHLGNAWSFTLTWLAARSQNGHVRLRVDDLDAARFRDEYLEDIFASLRWLGLDWDGGPRDAAEFKSAHSQRLKRQRYDGVVQALRAGRFLYACRCSREAARREAGAAGRPTIYAGTCRDQGLDFESEGAALRYRVPATPVRVRDESGRSFELRPDRDLGDFIVRQRNGDASYQVASVADDEEADTNFVVRGMDLLPSTGAQLSLANSLAWTSPSQARYWHHALLLDDSGGKLSKSRGAESLRALREKFPDPAPIHRFFARGLGIDSAGIASIRDLLSGFRPEKVTTVPLRLSDFWREQGG